MINLGGWHRWGQEPSTFAILGLRKLKNGFGEKALISPRGELCSWGLLPRKRENQGRREKGCCWKEVFVALSAGSTVAEGHSLLALTGFYSVHRTPQVRKTRPGGRAVADDEVLLF